MSGASGSMVFRHTAKLCMHRKEKHSLKSYRETSSVSETQPTAGKRRRKNAYPCRICGKLFLHHLSLNAHYTATSCLSAIKKAQATGNDSNLPDHRPNDKVKASLAQGKTLRNGPGRPRQEEDEEDLVEAEGEFPCPSCTEVFSLQSQLRDHVELHNASMVSRECSVCTEEMDTFERPASRRQRFYHCVPCQEGFSALDSFLEHCQEHLQARDEEEDCATEGSKHQASKA
ncbi:zinc finger protein 354B [Phycodurus eques]|uniref:zinc finger protein 354B n=1 Tax=Phycodurus eques TaxID=693459 RepID=UPI002ACE3F0E|nr:zinc finger protein 354B [Phycodurus eques]XP_061557841.1 zinc finger protein 354B [Phycodurus eques]XP_061557929.1 zinc finger protein 354B [Phycodurus eques]XP_061558020.1 zinc finger protein 354B [Phycodurus eques]XP_061558105.1 zinc finger protein 354B [Phycodurus eques]